MRAYSSGVTLVPIDFDRRDAIRIPSSVARNPVVRRPNVVIRGSCRGTESSECRESRTIRAVPIGEPPVPCSTRDGVTCHLLLPVRSTATRTPPLPSCLGEVDEPRLGQAGRCSDSDSDVASNLSSAFVMSPRRYASIAIRSARRRGLTAAWCRGRESNPHDPFESQDFKSCAYASKHKIAKRLFSDIVKMCQ